MLSIGSYKHREKWLSISCVAKSEYDIKKARSRLQSGYASPVWLETILQVFQTIKPMPGVVGGKIDPIWEALPPSWLSENLQRSRY